MVEFGNLLTAMVTPFNEDGEVDYQTAKNLAIKLVENGSGWLGDRRNNGRVADLNYRRKADAFFDDRRSCGW